MYGEQIALPAQKRVPLRAKPKEECPYLVCLYNNKEKRLHDTLQLQFLGWVTLLAGSAAVSERLSNQRDTWRARGKRRWQNLHNGDDYVEFEISGLAIYNMMLLFCR